MHVTSVHPAERLRGNAEPSGTTDLNTLLAGLLATMPVPVSLRCDTLPPAAGAEEEWWLLLQWILQPLKRPCQSLRYVHVQCGEDPASRDRRYLLSLRCNDLEGAATPGLSNPQLSALAARLQVQVLPPASYDTHCLFILQFAGK
ncbi:hypothetical protein [Flaviaesturariibacter aridisoli]|uniref:Uncharacterized protein n=1 Tax=Flaviaesturariibacter aridisoli TaxID=2545761 RepID=A0A4R4DXD2_9BACT|nr:hypothetical protein [Flaviaesturariibacter aridisoli]TCZ69589.1 hypothetical protein E0486_12225 [Flaviaesturariibacter aridisoli]